MRTDTPTCDVVVFGATSFVGRLVARYLLDEFGVRGSLRWAAAGRSAERLRTLRSSLGPKAARLPLLVADAEDEESLRRLCAETRVVVSTVGPYALHGEPLVKVCAETGTDYCDLTGEPQWIRRMLDRYETTARKSGARIVHCCGFDSVPSDLGVLFLQQEARKRYGQPCTRVKMRVKAIRGGFSGGTAASALNAVKEAVADPALRKELANPYSLCPRGHSTKVRQPRVRVAEYDADFAAWAAPFVMGVVNTRIVHRSNALSKNSYGAGFRYDEAVLTGRGLKGRVAATAVTAGMASLAAAAAIGPVRSVIGRLVARPGSGPDEKTRQQGFYDLRFLGQTDDGQALRVKVTGQGDPGYASTAKILGQAGACLAQDLPKTTLRGGFWTPATAFGSRFVERLVAHADVRFEVLE
jgi:short subunit dehydrogenase-like uncharacterized protein